MILPPPLSEFDQTSATFLGQKKNVYRIGTEGPGVLLMHEIPGITPAVLRLAKVIADRGYRVALPSLFGTDGADYGTVAEAEQIVRACVSAEFAVFAANGSSPIVDWLRALAVDLANETGGNVGAVGLCITGGFALSLTVGTDGHVVAPVMSEPSLPFSVPFSNGDAAMHLTEAEQEAIRAGGPPVPGLRFTNDGFCKKARFDAYEALLGPGRFIRVELASPNPADGIGPHAHSVLTKDLVDVTGNPTLVALDRVLAFLDEQLRAAG